MSRPLVSALIPNFNHSRYLRRCFAGLLGQTYGDFEIIVTDDGSTDDSAAIIADYASRDSRIKPHYFPANRGMKACFQNLMDRATGTYVYGGAADDFVINADFFRKAVTALESEPRAAGFYGITGIYQDETEKLVSSCGTAEVEGYNTPRQCAEGFLKCRSVVTSPSCIWRRELYQRHGGHDMDALLTRFGAQMDFYLNHFLAFTYGVCYERTPVACQRVFATKSNYSANMHLWETAARFATVEQGLRAVGLSYDGIEADWFRWRAFWMMDTIRKSGVKL